MTPDEHAIVEAVTSRYLTSGDFNGTAVSAIRTSDAERRELICGLVEQQKLSVVVGGSNPAVKHWPSEPIEDQVAKIRNSDLEYAWMYPSPGHLEDVVDRSKYAGNPFTLRLALGAGQLEYCAFDLAVLERYRNDCTGPRSAG